MPKGWACGTNSSLDTATLAYTKVLLTQHLSLWTSAGFSLNATQKSLKLSEFGPVIGNKFQVLMLHLLGCCVLKSAALPTVTVVFSV